MAAEPYLVLLFAVSDCFARYQFNWNEKQCPQWIDSSIFLSGSQIPFGRPMRAYETLPEGFSIRPSVIEGAGLGVFAETFIKKYTWLGEYEGEFLPLNMTWLSGAECAGADYAWLVVFCQLRSGGRPAYYVDARPLHSSNWLRFINNPRHSSEENVASAECYGRVYYRTKRHLWPGVELMVMYGPDYARRLGVNMNDFYKPRT